MQHAGWANDAGAASVDMKVNTDMLRRARGSGNVHNHHRVRYDVKLKVSVFCFALSCTKIKILHMCLINYFPGAHTITRSETTRAARRARRKPTCQGDPPDRPHQPRRALADPQDGH